MLAAVAALLPGPARRAVAQRRGLADTAHRPWPVPGGRWVIGQSWNDLLFAHWPLPTEEARRIVPEPLEPDLFEGRAYVGVVPFRMQTVRFAWCPPVAGTSSFAELNVRTYVTLDGKPGVFFLSLDVGNLIALEIGRRGFGLPYFRADVSLTTEGGRVRFRARRHGHHGAFEARVRPGGTGAGPAAGHAGSLADRALLLLHRAQRPAVADRGPPPALAPPAGRVRHRRAAAALLACAGRGGLAG